MKKNILYIGLLTVIAVSVLNAQSYLTPSTITTGKLPDSFTAGKDVAAPLNVLSAKQAAKDASQAASIAKNKAFEIRMYANAAAKTGDKAIKESLGNSAISALTTIAAAVKTAESMAKAAQENANKNKTTENIIAAQEAEKAVDQVKEVLPPIAQSFGVKMDNQPPLARSFSINTGGLAGQIGGSFAQAAGGVFGELVLGVANRIFDKIGL